MMTVKDKVFKVLTEAGKPYTAKGLERACEHNKVNKKAVSDLLGLDEEGRYTAPFEVDAKSEILKRLDKHMQVADLTDEGTRIFSDLRATVDQSLDNDLKIEGTKLGRYVRKTLVKASGEDSDTPQIDELVTELSAIHSKMYTTMITTNFWDMLLMSVDAHFTSCMAIDDEGNSYDKGTANTAVDDCTVMVVVLDEKGKKVFRQLFFVTPTTLIPSRVYSQNGTDRYTETVLNLMKYRLGYTDSNTAHFNRNKEKFISDEGRGNTYNDFLEGHDTVGIFVKVVVAIPTPQQVCWHCGKLVDEVNRYTRGCENCTPNDDDDNQKCESAVGVPWEDDEPSWDANGLPF